MQHKKAIKIVLLIWLIGMISAIISIVGSMMVHFSYVNGEASEQRVVYESIYSVFYQGFVVLTCGYFFFLGFSKRIFSVFYNFVTAMLLFCVSILIYAGVYYLLINPLFSWANILSCIALTTFTNSTISFFVALIVSYFIKKRAKARQLA